MNELRKAWAAGFLDGEGAVMIVHMRPKTYRRRGRIEHKPSQVLLHVRIGHSDRAPLDLFAMMFGGAVKELDMTVPARRANRRQMYEWNLYGAKAAAVLAELRPYLVVKAAHVDLALEFHSTCFGVTSDLTTRLDYYKQMAKMQQKGQHLRLANGA